MNKPDKKCIIVDGSCIQPPGIIEYRGMLYPTKEIIFSKGPIDGGTNNIAEFLGIVSGMMYSVKHNLLLPVYSDSQTAIAWVRKGRHNSTMTRNKENENIFQMLEQTEEWLARNKNKIAVEKWQTKLWGEIPCDYGRK